MLIFVYLFFYDFDNKIGMRPSSVLLVVIFLRFNCVSFALECSNSDYNLIFVVAWSLLISCFLFYDFLFLFFRLLNIIFFSVHMRDAFLGDNLVWRTILWLNVMRSFLYYCNFGIIRMRNIVDFVVVGFLFY